MRCSHCRSTGHTEKNCPKTFGGPMNRYNMYCSVCGSRDHNPPACPKTWGGSAARAWHPDDIADDYIKDRKKKKESVCEKVSKFFNF